ncbi:Rab proteins geranylgeranyltransferase component A [Coelomomyces lativittatus]|nr:Rab proteins geranylgeranyltransferase component A [Coelomomyces lativittatus]
MIEETIDSHFDVIVLGTGFHESLMAATLSRNGKKVLHVDTASNYGGIWRSYLLSEFIQGSSTLHLN